MRAGFAEADITPALGMEAPGDYWKAYISAIHDPLKVRAVVLDDGDCPLAMLSVDTCTLPAGGFAERVRAGIEERTGIPAASILVAATHTHSGGPLWSLAPEELEGMPELERTLITEHSIHADPLYQEWAVGQAITAGVEAHRTRSDALISVGSGEERDLPRNRRFRMANGRVYSHPGKGNPDIVEPAGPVDPEVGVLGAWSPEGKLLGCVVNYTCHCTTFGGAVSSDYVCYLAETIRALHGEGVGIVFLNGACGDVTQVDNQSLRAPEFGEWWSRYAGTRIGAEALKVLAGAVPSREMRLAAAREMLPLRRRPPSAERLVAARARVEEGLSGGVRDTEWVFAKELVLLGHMCAKRPVVATEVMALQVGPAVYASCPAELFCELGLRVKQGSPFPHTWVVELANGNVGYVPPRAALEPGGGGYETVLTTHTNLEVDAGDRIVEGCLRLVGSLTPGPLPRLPELPEPQGPWSYGVLGPELE